MNDTKTDSEKRMVLSHRYSERDKRHEFFVFMEGDIDYDDQHTLWYFISLGFYIQKHGIKILGKLFLRPPMDFESASKEVASYKINGADPFQKMDKLCKKISKIITK